MGPGACINVVGEKYLGVAAGNRTAVVWSPDIVMKTIHTRVYVTRMLVNNLSACIEENPSLMGRAIWCDRKWPI